jgi:hypothetical protein
VLKLAFPRVAEALRYPAMCTVQYHCAAAWPSSDLRYLEMNLILKTINNIIQITAISMDVIIPVGSEPTFHPFPRLPIELRFKIWRVFASRSPRIVTLYEPGRISLWSSGLFLPRFRL